MRFSSLLLVGSLAFVVCCGVASPSKDVYSKTATSDIVTSADFTSITRKDGRRLRATETADADRYSESGDEERANAFWDDIFSYVMKQITSKKDKSPPKAELLPRSKSLPSEKVASPVLTRSKSVTHQKIDMETANAITKSIQKDVQGKYKNTFATMDRQKQDPDQMFDFFGLDRKYALTTKANKHKLVEAAGGQIEKYGNYVLWYQFSKYYKRQHPKWVSRYARGTSM